MSAETAEWLNTQVLIGNTDNRGNAWHYRAELQGGESNHYSGAIPATDIIRRLLNWEPVKAPITVQVGDVTIVDNSRSVLVRPPMSLNDDDPGMVLGVASESYQHHSYKDEGIHRLAAYCTDGIDFSAAGLLKGGAQFWAELSAQKEWEHGGVKFRPNLLFVTSCDGKLATQVKECATDSVCDNTVSAALGDGKGEHIKVKHTRHSLGILEDKFSAMEFVTALGEKRVAQLEMLLNTPISGAQTERFLDVLHPLKDDKGEPLGKTGTTRREGIRSEYHTLLNADPRVSPWQGTAFGLMAAHNTYVHHVAPVRGGDDVRASRNMDMMVSGGFDKVDREAREAIELITA